MGSSGHIELPPQSNEEERNCMYAMQLLTSSVLPFVLNSTIELDVFEILAKNKTTKLSASEIVSHIPNCKNPDAATMLDRMLYVLASYSLLDCSVDEEGNRGAMERRYGLSGVGKFFVRDEVGASMGPLLALLQDKVFINSW